MVLNRTNLVIPRPGVRSSITIDNGLEGTIVNILWRSAPLTFLSDSLFQPIEPHEDKKLLLNLVSALGLGLSISSVCGPDADDDVVFPLLATPLRKHPSYLKSFALHELSRLPSSSVVRRLARTSPLFACVFHLFTSKSEPGSNNSGAGTSNFLQLTRMWTFFFYFSSAQMPLHAFGGPYTPLLAHRSVSHQFSLHGQRGVNLFCFKTRSL
jgi:hypothetical protein